MKRFILVLFLMFVSLCIANTESLVGVWDINFYQEISILDGYPIGVNMEKIVIWTISSDHTITTSVNDEKGRVSLISDNYIMMNWKSDPPLILHIHFFLIPGSPIYLINIIYDKKEFITLNKVNLMLMIATKRK